MSDDITRNKNKSSSIDENRVNNKKLNSENNIKNKKIKKDNNNSDEIETLKLKIKESEDKYLLAHAELENYKKRLEKEKSDAIAYGFESLFKELILVVDNLERGLDSLSEVDENTKMGVELTLKQLLKVFEKNGVVEVDCSDKFDPNLHQAVMNIEPNDKLESGDISKVLQKGYLYKDRPLRASMVEVVK